MDDVAKAAAKILDSVGSRLVFALLIFIVGRIAIRALMKILKKNQALDKTEGTVKTFALSFVNIGLYVVLTISVVGIIGVPMASVIAVLASAGATVGLALQGALSNLAGGVMLMIFKPFKQDDYVEATGVAGSVREVTLFYTVLLTPDNKYIMVPNGTLMNANVINYSHEEKRRVDLTFTCSRDENPARVQMLMKQVIDADARILREPDAAEPIARLWGSTRDEYQFAVKVWCPTSEYWNVYYDLTQFITEALVDAGVQAPVMKIKS